MRERFTEWDEKIVIAGQLFERTDMIYANDSRIAVKEGSPFRRECVAKFAEGTPLKLSGQFLQKGKLSFPFQIKDIHSPVVLLLHQYVRRGQSEVKFLINGNLLSEDKRQDIASEVATNHWIQKGIVIEEKHLLSASNTLEMQVGSSDLDYGFFDCAIYQPKMKGEGR
jgi:hypothetical protein